jgi:transcriptional antiterminator RfaH
MIRWYAVHAQVNAEAKACLHLRNQGFGTYLPRYMRRRSHARRVELVPTPLFPRYLFVEFDREVVRWRAIRSTVGVSGLVTHGDVPTPVPVGIVEGIMAREDEHGMVPVASTQRFAPGDKVEILDGALEGLTALFEGTTDQQRVILLLDLLGRQVRVTVPTATIRAA